jgi:hypothetical protein
MSIQGDYIRQVSKLGWFEVLFCVGMSMAVAQWISKGDVIRACAIYVLFLGILLKISSDELEEHNAIKN